MIFLQFDSNVRNFLLLARALVSCALSHPPAVEIVVVAAEGEHGAAIAFVAQASDSFRCRRLSRSLTRITTPSSSSSSFPSNFIIAPQYPPTRLASTPSILVVASVVPMATGGGGGISERCRRSLPVALSIQDEGDKMACCQLPPPSMSTAANPYRSSTFVIISTIGTSTSRIIMGAMPSLPPSP